MNSIHTIYESLNLLALPAAKDLPEYISNDINVMSCFEMILYKHGAKICRFSNKRNSGYLFYLEGNKIIDMEHRKVISIDVGDEIVLVKVIRISN